MHRIVLSTLALAVFAFAQTDRGTITGTVSDPAGAVVASAPIEARNTGTGAVFQAASSATGNYTIPALPSGTYEISVTVPGFKKYVRQNLLVQNAQTIRIDVGLEVGNASESVTVTEAAPLLKTESGELSHVVTTDRMDNLPILQTGAIAGSGGIRNPMTAVALLPGSALIQGTTGPTVRVNGGVNNSYTMLVEGMDATNGLGAGASQQNQSGVDSIQEWAIQTSNYAAEFGQVGNAVMNVTMKSGTNRFHGSLYEYFVHEKLNAGQPFTNNGQGGLIRVRQRRNDYGFTIGGPVWIPKVYDGRDKTFFFYNWEEYRIGTNVLPEAISVPTAAYRQGDFSAARLTNSLGNDPAGRPIFPNLVYDPLTRRTIGTQIVTDPFTNNTIPLARFDPVAVKVQALIPNPTSPNLIVNNFRSSYRQERTTGVPSLKVDQNFGTKHKVAVLLNRTRTFCWYCAGAEGMLPPISATIGTDIRAHTERVNWDTTLSPTLLLHMGVGFSQNWLGRPALVDDFDATAQLGLTGPFSGQKATFPVIQFPATQAQGGMANMGSTAALADDVFQQGSAIVSLTWVKDNHTFKFGGELRNQGNYRLDGGGINGTYVFAPQQTAMPYVVASNANAQVGGNTIGFPYASFLLGLVNTVNVKPETRARIGKRQLGFYMQDTWKVTRKLTLDVGLRYDYSTYLQEQYGRMASLAPDLPNPSAGGHPGSVTYEAVCNCNFAKNYPWGFGPRIGAAYQITSKTVLRAGFGIVYSGTPQYNLAGGNLTGNNLTGPNADFGREIMTLRNGLPLTQAQIAWPNFDPGYFPINSAVNKVGAGPPQVIDQNGGRPSRQYQWSLGLQREILRNLVVEGSYVGNRHIWLTSNTQANYNYLTTERLAAYGLNLNNPADLNTLNATLSSPAAGRFQNRVPFNGFPVSGTVAQSLRPFPQFNGGLAGFWTPRGNAWYDSFQGKVTKRFSHGLDFTYSFTFQKEIDNLSMLIGTVQYTDFQNPSLAKSLSLNSRPFVNGFAFNYVVPVFGGNKILSWAARDWTVGGFLQYGSGLPIAPPAATTTPALGNVAFQNTFQNRVAGQPAFTQDLNCHCFDPNTTFVLNPRAWSNPGPGQFGSATFYNDYRQQRRPLENLAFGRTFHIKERATFNVRAEFTNVFNRTFMQNPTSVNPAAVQTRASSSDANSQTTAGFGFINNTTVQSPPRNGQIVARFQF